MRTLLLINGVAGTAQMGRSAYHIIEKLALAGHQLTVCPVLPSKGLGAELLLEDREKAAAEGKPCLPRPEELDLVVCAGGDGTLSHLVDVLMHVPAEVRPKLGYLPAGSTNDFARSLGIPSNLDGALAAVTGDKTYRYDVGRFGDRYFNYIAAFGAFAAVSYSTDQQFKNAVGHAAYVLNAISQLPQNLSYKCTMRIEIDEEETLEGEFVFGALYNTLSMGGLSLPVLEGTQLDDGVFELMLIRAPANLEELGDIVTNLLDPGMTSPYVLQKKVRHVRITTDENTAWTLDGEYGGEPGSVEISVSPGAIELMVP